MCSTVHAVSVITATQRLHYQRYSRDILLTLSFSAVFAITKVREKRHKAPHCWLLCLIIKVSSSHSKQFLISVVAGQQLVLLWARPLILPLLLCELQKSFSVTHMTNTLMTSFPPQLQFVHKRTCWTLICGCIQSVFTYLKFLILNTIWDLFKAILWLQSVLGRDLCLVPLSWPECWTKVKLLQQSRCHLKQWEKQAA